MKAGRSRPDTFPANQFVNVLSGDEGAIGLQVVSPIDLILPDKIDVLRAPINYQAAPVSIHQQKASIALCVVLDTKLDEDFFRDRYVAEKMLQDAVLSPLGKHPKLCPVKVSCRSIEQLSSLYSPQSLLNLLQRSSMERRRAAPALNAEKAMRESFRLS